MRNQPSTDRGRESMLRITDTACDLFYRQGVNATGLAEIAAASGTGKGQLYHFFDDKADLVLAVVQRQVEITTASMAAGLLTVTEPADLRAWADQLLSGHPQAGSPRRCPLGALAIEVAGSDERVRQALSDGFTGWRALIAGRLDQLVEHAGLQANSPPTGDLADAFVAAYEGGVLLGGVHRDNRSLRVAVHAAVDWIIANLGEQPHAA